MRDVACAIPDKPHTGGPWGMPPHDLPPKSTAFGYFERRPADGTARAIPAARG